MEQIGYTQEQIDAHNRMTLEERQKWVEEETEKRLKFFHKLRTQNKAVFAASGESE